jgi:copper chaperone CopZ
VSKSLGRLDVVRDVKTELKTQSSTVTFKPGKPIDFRALADAVDKAGFKAGAITIWAKGSLRVSDGRATFTVSGTSQAFPVADSPQLAGLVSGGDKEVTIVAKVQFTETPPRLVLMSEPEKESMPGMKGMGGAQGMGR